MKRLALLASLALAACAPLGPPPPLTAAAASGPTNAPFYNAASGATSAFRDTAALAGRPADAALAVERLEFLAAQDYQSAGGPLGFTAITGPGLQAARYEVRRAVGIATDAPPATVVAALEAVREALARGDSAGAEAALAAPTFTPGALARLSSLPRLPQANTATLRLQRDLEGGPTEQREMSSLFRRLPGRG